MPLFLSEEEFNRHSGDPSLIADKADSYIRDLLLQLETVKAKSDATAITAEQTCSLLEQKYISLSSDFESLETENRSLSSSIEQRLSELAETQAEKHQIHLKAIGKDGEVERLSVEVTELHKSKRQLLELLEQKDSEIGEKNSLINSYLSKIVNLTDEAALKEAKLHDSEAESARCHAACARLSQEKELLEKHNMWLNEELTGKLNSLVELRKTHAEFETDMSAKVADVERQFNDCSSSLNWHKERVRELENKLISVQEELLSCKDAAAANEERFSAEVTTVTKLAELYKESSEEWSRKAGDLEGVIKALETHLSQVEDDYKGKLEKETLLKKCLEKEAAELKEKLDKREVEIENSRNANELALLPISSFENVPIIEERWFGGNETNDKSEDNMMLVPKIPAGVSGTALAASLMRDGWSLAKMYEKYQEAIDAFRHERLGRKHSEAILERVLHEIEEKAEMILDERAEHERLVEAYNLINQQLQHSFSEHTKFEATVREMKADLRQHERDYNIAQKEIVDLQKQVTVLLKECRDIQLRYGGTGQSFPEDSLTNGALEVDDESGVESIISERLLTFKDINGLVEQNVKLRSLVRCLSHQSGQRDAELRERFENELQKQKDEAAEKVSAVLKRSEEQAHMIEALHNSVAMYKRLYEEELKARPNHHSAEPAQEDGKENFMLLFEGSHEATKKLHEQAIERARSLEEELTSSRNEAFSLRLERDKLAMEAKFAGEKLDRFMKESEHQREETNGVLARNVEFSQLIVDYQKKLRDTADSLLASEERSRKLSMEVSVLKHERDIWINSEKRASEEARSLSERVHRLQASLDTIQSAEEVRKDSRALERRKQEEYVKRMEREWAEAKKELQEERDRVRTLTQEKDQTLTDAMRQVEELGKQLADALRGVTAAEARATTAEARCSELEANVKSFERKSIEENRGPSDSMYSTNKVTEDLLKATEEIEKLKEEAQFNKDHMLQYKEIAQVNEIALKQMESAHENFKDEADKLKKSLEAEVVSLRVRVSDLERDVISKSVEASSTVAEKEAALCSALSEINRLREDNSLKMSQLMTVEIQTSSLKEEVDEEHQRWRAAQNNYERQVILQSETIQELTKTSQALASLQDEVSKLRRLADAQKSENDILKATLETEKTMLESSKNEVEKKYNEINEQNKILHNRLEALHITVAEKERTSAGIFSTNSCPDLQGDGLQTVINYLRRSKEIAETEISLFKQEKLRLQSQLEGALKASDNAQSLLRAERASSRAAMFTDEEFKTLKLQVSELNLLRESNMQLREENKYNFEECQKLREIAQKAATETEYLNNLLREREAELDASKKETEMLNIEKRHLESRISELLERAKDINVDVEDYERIKEDFRQIQLKLLEKETEVEEIKKNINEKQDTIAKLEQELANTHSGYTEAEKRLTSILQSEAMLKTDIEKQKKIISNYKKKTESLTKDKEELMKEKQALSKQIEESSKEKQALSKQIESSIKEKQALSKQIEDLIKEKQTLSKQIEDFRTSKKTIGDTSTEQAMKEKDTRIHMLEKTIEREKARRVKTEDTVVGLVANVRQEKQKMVEELEKHKRARESLLLLESGTSAAQLPSETGLDDQTSAYLLAVDNFEEEAQSILTDVTVSHQSSAEIPLVASTSGTIGYQASAQGHVTQPSLMALATNPSHSKPAEEREKQVLTARPNLDTCKTGRKLVRPRLERSREQISDVDMLEIEGATTMEEPNAAPSHDPEIQGPLLKKLKESDSSTAGISTEEQAAQSYEIPEKLPNMEETGDVYLASSEELVDIVKDEEMDNETEPTEELKEPLDSSNQGNLRNESTAAAELLVEKAIETDEVSDDVSKGLELQDQQYSALEAENETEEGELVLGGTEQQEVSDIPVNVGDSEAGESQTELLDDDVDALAAEVSLGEGKNKSGEVLEEVNEALDKSNNNNGDNNNYKNTVFESKRSPQASFGGGEESSSDVSQNVVSKQAARSPVREREEEKEAPPSGRIVNLGERARENSFLRRAGVMNPILARGRGRAGGAQKRIGRGRGVRGQPPRDKEQ